MASNMIDKKIWKKELFGIIEEIGNIEELTRLWRGERPGEISSFVEAISFIFDDYEINKFIDLGKDFIGINDRQFMYLVKFRDLFESLLHYWNFPNPQSINQEEVIQDPKWKAVCDAAAKFSASLKN